jgi:hypothetical protein
VLVVDRVVLDAVEQVQKVRKLECRRSSRRQQRRDTAHEVVEIRDLREDVVSDDEARALSLGDQALRHLAPEERDERRNALLLRSFRDVGRRVDSEHLDAAPEKVLKQIAVVRSELDDEVVRA